MRRVGNNNQRHFRAARFLFETTRNVPARGSTGRQPSGYASPGSGANCVPDPDRPELLPPAQRHDPVAAASALPIAEDFVCAGFRPDRPDHPDLPSHRVTVATHDRHLDRPLPETVFVGRRHGLDPVRIVVALASTELSRLAAGRRHDRQRIGRIPSGVLTHRAARLRWTTRTGAIAVPGGWKRGVGLRPPAGGVHHHAARDNRASPGLPWPR
jgi:hypothetical protein